MRNMTSRSVTLPLENALYPILAYLVSIEGAESVANGLTMVAHAGHRMERRLQEQSERRARAAKRLGRSSKPTERPTSQLPRPVVALTDAEVYAIRRRHELVEERGPQDDIETARADRGALLRENDRIRIELVRAQEEIDGLRSQLAVMDDPLEHDLAMLGVEPSCSCCGVVIRGEVHVLAAASTWAEGEADDYDRDVEVCAACARREGPAAAAVDAPRPRLASGTRKLLLPLRKAG